MCTSVCIIGAQPMEKVALGDQTAYYKHQALYQHIL